MPTISVFVYAEEKILVFKFKGTGNRGPEFNEIVPGSIYQISQSALSF